MAGGAGAKALEMLSQYESGNDVRQVISCSENGRALRLLKRREESKSKADAAKADIENESKKRKFTAIDDKFGSSHADILEEEFKKQTVGLHSLQDFQEKRKQIDDLIAATRAKEKDGTRLRLTRKIQSKKLSFGDAVEDDDDDDDDDDEDDEEGEKAAPVRRRSSGIGKDPSVDTSFLRDSQREREILDKKDELIKEYTAQQDLIKQEKLEITYSYWDGSGHRRSVQVQKGFTIGQFLQKCKADLEKQDFPELRTVGVDNLMYIKEDLIIPNNTTFYELIKDKARGKSGPLFNFDVHEDIRMASDIRVEKDESHAGKIVDRKWYERNKHIFPASRWETYSKDKTYDQYTIRGDTDHSRAM